MGSLLPAVGIYVGSLFSLIALKTSGGWRGSLEWQVAEKYPSHVCTNTYTHCRCIMQVADMHNINDTVHTDWL